MCDILNPRLKQSPHLLILDRQLIGSWPRAAGPDRWTSDSPLQTSGDKFKRSLASFSTHLSLLYSCFTLAYQLAFARDLSKFSFLFSGIQFFLALRMLSPLFCSAG